ncbi:unnamed protein product [Arctogadus glacialis]
MEAFFVGARSTAGITPSRCICDQEGRGGGMAGSGLEGCGGGKVVVTSSTLMKTQPARVQSQVLYNSRRTPEEQGGESTAPPALFLRSAGQSALWDSSSVATTAARVLR